MSQTQARTMTRRQMREILQRHKGSIAEIARQLEISHVSVSLWLKNKSNSQRIEAAVTAKAHELLEMEHS